MSLVPISQATLISAIDNTYQTNSHSLVSHSSRRYQVTLISDYAQSWTRSRLPVDRPLPFDLTYNEDAGGWRTPLRHLLAAPGYEWITCGRNIEDPEEVLFITTWRDSASLQAFTESDGYASYFQALGIHCPRPNAFFTFEPSDGPGILDSRVMIFTFSFEFPVEEEARIRFNRLSGLYVTFPDHPFRLPVRWGRAWVKGPTVGEDNQLVEHSMLIQPFSIADEDREGQNKTQERVSKDPRVRGDFYRQVEKLNLKLVEEVTWDIGSAEYD